MIHVFCCTKLQEEIDEFDFDQKSLTWSMLDDNAEHERLSTLKYCPFCGSRLPESDVREPKKIFTFDEMIDDLSRELWGDDRTETH